ncbi:MULTISPECIES: BrxA family protein [unclassified Sphingopyxis]|uniref:BrxA family protein n=1 Tax=unclassified Sphingopyxis TaxID=2614943 RepID=UPI0009E7EB1E|nr:MULTISPECIES: BrxA family protein [unclassified Sphingopyxis]
MTPRGRAPCLQQSPLKLYESRVIAGLLLESVSAEKWKQAIEVENVLQKTSLGTAKRQASLIRTRLKTMTPDHWRLVRDGSKPLAT